MEKKSYFGSRQYVILHGKIWGRKYWRNGWLIILMNQSCIRLYRTWNVRRKLLCTCTIFSTNIKPKKDSIFMDRLKFNYLFKRFRFLTKQLISKQFLKKQWFKGQFDYYLFMILDRILKLSSSMSSALEPCKGTQCVQYSKISLVDSKKGLLAINAINLKDKF